ncbi:hypothetical protein ACFL1Z_06995 [Thermodesulfobacteriota bacterium]
MKTELFQCIGGLAGKKLISIHVCGRRYLLAIKRAQVSAKTDFDIARLTSLGICGTCLEGHINAKSCKNEFLGNANSNL